MHVDDIEADLANSDLRGIENAFRALVGFPGEHAIEGIETADHLPRLLRLSAGALAEDQSNMPGGTRDILDELAGDRVGETGTYSAGAAVALEHAAYFHETFDRGLIAAPIA